MDESVDHRCGGGFVADDLVLRKGSKSRGGRGRCHVQSMTGDLTPPAAGGGPPLRQITEAMATSALRSATARVAVIAAGTLTGMVESGTRRGGSPGGHALAAWER